MQARSVQTCCATAAEGLSQEPDCTSRLLLYRSSGQPFQAAVLAMPLADRRGGCASCWLCVCDVTAASCPRVNDITLGRVLGAGAFGTVHIGAPPATVHTKRHTVHTVHLVGQSAYIDSGAGRVAHFGREGRVDAPAATCARR